MSWGLVAGAGAMIYSSYQSSKDASDSRSDAKEASQAELNFAYEQYDDWKETYGDVESNLASYYNTMTPETYAAQGIEAFETSYAATQEQLKQTWAQRGISEDSGIAMSLNAQNEISAAESRAAIRLDAESQYVQDQANFLSVGMGNSATNTVANALSNNTTTTANAASAATAASGQAFSNAATGVGTAINAAYNYYQPKAATS